MSNVAARFVVSPSSPIETKFEVNVQSNDHNLLQNRDLPNQHPISAITGLQEALDNIPDDYITDAELEAALLEKQDVISDLATIRSGAALGATAVQPSDLDNYATRNWVENQGYLTEIPSEYVTDSELTAKGYQTAEQVETAITSKGYITNDALNGYATENYVDTGLNGKQDTINDLATIRTGAALGATAIQPNDNISELNNNVGYITGITSSDVTTALGYTPYNSSNPSNYQTATQVANSIATETTNRENADNNLQSQIDAIVSSSDVFDIVGTYAELQAYDITTVPVNDIIKVLVDSTHSDAATYYRCVETGGVKSWSYIGSEGAYYTKGEADAAFVPQTRTVNNKALSSNITLTASDVGADVSGAASTAETNAKNYADGLAVNYATAAQGALADTSLQPNDNISELVNNAGYITGITSTDVTTALGYTPYNSTNPDGYITNSALVGYATQTWVGQQGYITGITSSDVTTALGYTPIETIATGSTNGTISVDGTDVSVYGLGSAAYTASTAYATAAQGGLAVTAVQPGDLTNYVTTGTNQDITGVKTFIGDKRIKFKQSASGNKLGFTLYDNNNKEAASFEYRPNTINGYPLLYLGQYKGSDTSQYINTQVYVGFRNYDFVSSVGAAYNLVAPLAKDARAPFSLTATHQTFYLPLGVSDGNTTVRTGSDGVLNISTLLPSVPTVNNATLTITQGGVSKGTFTANASSNVTIDLDAGGGSSYTAGTGIDITNDVISVTSPTLTNTATGTNSLTVNGSATSEDYSVNVGASSSVLNTGGVSIGYYARATASYGIAIGFSTTAGGSGFSVAIGDSASATANYAIQLGAYGTNSEASSFYVSTSVSDNWKMLGSDGLIPDARISSNIARSVDIPTIDQTYSSSSANAQSGVAVASAISTMLSTLYPVGSIYIGTQATCPLATLISGSTWTLVSKGRVLQGADTGQTAGSTLAAGLPNIKGSATSTNAGGATCYNNTMTGAIVLSDITGSRYFTSNTTSSTDIHMGIGFDASQSNSIYGNSTTVQPPAYLVNIWERTA